MAMSDYYDIFRRQEYNSRPTVYPPPYDTESAWYDGTEIMGVFLQGKSMMSGWGTEIMIASSQSVNTYGQFVTSPDAPVHDGDVLRRAKDGIYIRLIGYPLVSPNQAESQIKAFGAEITDRSEPHE